MPTYQYACTACGAQSEVVQKFSDDALTVCEACGGRLRKVFSAVGIVFKGPGFYRTDSRSAPKEPAAAAKANGSEAAAKASSDSSSAGSSSKESSGSGSSSSASSNGSSSAGSASGSKPSSSKVA